MHIINRFKNQNLSAQIIDFYNNPQNIPELRCRQSHCLTSLNDLSSNVELLKKKGAERAHYKGLQTCGSPWSCEICAIKISEYRKNELSELIDAALAAGKFIYMLTTTLPHYSHESCQNVLDKFNKSTATMKRQRSLKGNPRFMPWGELMKHYQNDGYVITKEVLFGCNGWHIHSHGLFIFDKKIKSLVQAREDFWECWLKACDLTFQIADYPKHVLKGFYEKSIRLDHLSGDANKIVSEYMTKAGVVTKERQLEEWKMEHEMTKGHLKKSESHSFTPFGILDLIRKMEPSSKEAKFLKRKYYDYTQAFKGTSFVRWSPGLRSKYAIENKTDEEIVKDENDLLKDWYGYFEVTEWKENIVKNGLRGFVIQHSNLPFDEMIELVNAEIKKEKI